MPRPRTVLLGVAVAALAAVGVLVADALRARDELEQARALTAAVARATADGDPARADALLVRLQQHTADAVAATDGPLWAVATAVPVAGRTPAAVRGLAESADRLAREVVRPVLRLSSDLRPAQVRTAPDTVDVDRLARAAPAAARAATELEAVRRRTASLPTAWVPGPVADAVERTRAELARRAPDLRRAADALALLPPALGADGPRRYLLVLQTNAESRGTGGLVGAFAVLEADRGRVRVLQVDDNRPLAALPPPAAPVDADFERLYGPHYRLWANTNSSPHFPSAAALWSDSWQRGTGQALDGVIGLDLVALRHLVAATGPVPLPDGSLVDADGLVPLLGAEVYARFERDTDRRKDFLVAVADGVLDRVLRQGAGDPDALLVAVRRTAAERRLVVWSPRAVEQTALASARVTGELPDDDGAFTAVVVNNGGGNKLDYYLERAVDYRLGPCEGDRRSSTVSVRLTNAVPPGRLPAYVVGPDGGASRLTVLVYAARGAALERAVLDGRQVAVQAHAERGRPVFVLPLELGRGQSRELVLHLVEQPVPGPPVVLEQPLVRPQVTQVHDAPCAAA